MDLLFFEGLSAKKTILAFLIFSLIVSVGYTQSFEGILTYSTKFEMKGEFANLKDRIIEKLKKDGGYYDSIQIFIKQGNYKKVDNSLNHKSIIYLSDENKIYSLEKGFEYVSIIDASQIASFKLKFSDPQLVKIDSIKLINGIQCNAIKLTWGNIGEEWYFFNSEVAAIDSGLFADHNYEYLNQILNATGSYPLEMVKVLNNMMSIKMTLIAIEEVGLPDSTFDIPELKKVNNKSSRMMQQMSGAEIMKIKD